VLFSWALLYFPPLAKLLGTGPVDTTIYAVAWIGPFMIFGLDYLRKRVLALMRAKGVSIPGG
jgi:sodium/potassium-transporting ATPase subunit alpha